jgi:hypothetical protein
LSYTFPLTESLSRSALDRLGEEKAWLFETQLTDNPQRESRRRTAFPYFTDRNPLKSLDSEK